MRVAASFQVGCKGFNTGVGCSELGWMGGFAGISGANTPDPIFFDCFRGKNELSKCGKAAVESRI